MNADIFENAEVESNYKTEVNEILASINDEYEDNRILSKFKKFQIVITYQWDLIEKLRIALKHLKCAMKKDADVQTDYHKTEKNVSLVSTRDVYVQTVAEKNVETTDWNFENAPVEEIVKKVAQNAVNQTGFVYEETSGLYYDYNTGYYYNAEFGLYYDGQTGTYYKYDSETRNFQLHSKVEIPVKKEMPLKIREVLKDFEIEKKRIKSGTKCSKKPKKSNNVDFEDGEISDSDLSEISENSLKVDSSADSPDDVIKEPVIEESSKPWPPCMRIIVQNTKCSDLSSGSLFILTCTGGTLGREGEHAILIPDLSISKYHAKFNFNENFTNEEVSIDKIGSYTVTDLGSRNGTFLDGKRLSSALQESEPCKVSHNSVIRVGGTSLLCHIHSGNETCSDCEPGLLKDLEAGEIKNLKISSSSKSHKSELKRIKKKFGLERVDEELLAASVPSAGYEDKAEKRRQTIGSSSDSFKTEVASQEVPIANVNKGFKMLSKMGWSKGQTLGKKGDEGILEPISAEQRDDKVGLGYESVVGTLKLESNVSFKKKQEIWKKTRKRYKKVDAGTTEDNPGENVGDGEKNNECL